MKVMVRLTNPIHDTNNIFPDIEELWFEPKELAKMKDPLKYKLLSSKYKVDLECYVAEFVSYKKCKATGCWPCSDGVISVDKLEGLQ